MSQAHSPADGGGPVASVPIHTASERVIYVAAGLTEPLTRRPILPKVVR